MARLEGKIALITGAGTGIGRACMELFAKEGAIVFGISRTQSNLEETLSLVQVSGGTGKTFSADLSQPDEVQNAIDDCLQSFGRIDVLLNAAGVGYNLRESSEGSMDPIDTTPIDKWKEVMASNLDSVFYVSRLVIKQMKLQQKGSVVNISSIFGLGGAPDAHTYTATKGAIINLTKSMAVAYVDDNIRCNVVAPGFVQTQMVESVIPVLFSDANPKLISPMGRPATPEEVAYASLFFACEESSYCTGTVLAVDGGATGRA
jgi:NAD(P)-dependent dehydrogenase (short-subunit alcohol dehydrogenase family)